MLIKPQPAILVLLLTHFSIGAFGAPQWGIDISDTDENRACELKVPVQTDDDSRAPLKLWVGFYWLAANSNVPGYILPANQMLIIVRAQPPHEAVVEYREPTTLRIGDSLLKKYKFYGDSESSQYFLDGSEALNIFEGAVTEAEIVVKVVFEDGDTQILRVDTTEDTSFRVYAKMLELCGVEIAS